MGADLVTLSNPAEDCAVCFVITTNRPDSRDGNAVLRAQNTYDSIDFVG